jgi:amidase
MVSKVLVLVEISHTIVRADLIILGIPSSFVQSYAGNQPEIKAFNHSFNIMRSLGATVMTNANFPVTAVANSSSIPGWGNYGQSQVVLGVDFLVGFERYTSLLASNPQNVHTVPDLINFTESTPAEDYPDRNVKVWQYAVGLNLTQDSPEYTAALEEDLFLGGEGTLLGAMDKYDLDALILPSNQAWGIPAIAGKHPICTIPPPEI